MINYEVMFVIAPTLEEEKRDEVVTLVQDIISSLGTLGEVDVWGLKKLAYPIKKFNEGYYVVAQFAAEADMPKELDRRLRINDAVIRHIIVNKDEK